MIAPEEESSAEVRREDQDNINRFARLNARLHEIKRERDTIKQKLEHLEDASTELMMGSGDQVMLMVGEAFFETAEEAATEYCEALVEDFQAKLDTLQSEQETILQEVAELKRVLYGRFGKSINLEDKVAQST